MAIFFNKMARSNPQDPNSPKKWYLVLKRLVTRRTKEVAQEMADETTLNPKEAEIAIHQVVKVLKRMLKNGDSVHLDDLGIFYLTANSSPSDTEKEVTARNCTKLNIRFRPDASFQADIDKAQLKPASDLQKKETENDQ